VFWVGAYQDNVADPVALGCRPAAAALTQMVNGVIEVLLLPLLAVMMICPVAPSSAAPGIPPSAPVLVSNLIHAGCPDIANRTPVLLGETAAWNEYWIPTVALDGGAPCNVSAVEGVDADPLDEVVAMTPDTELLPVVVPVLLVGPVLLVEPMLLVVPVLLVVTEPAAVAPVLLEEELPPEQPPSINAMHSHSVNRALAASNSRPCIASSLRSAPLIRE
jgi:hypothetical protein